MENFNDSIAEYRRQVQKGDIVKAYRGLMDFMMNLRNHFRDRFPEYSFPGNIYSGYMDMTYFPVLTPVLKGKGLKTAIVLIHEDVRFEAWLSGYNKQIQMKYWSIVREKGWDRYRVPGTIKSIDSIVECDLELCPDFSNIASLTDTIETLSHKFIQDAELFFQDLD